MFLLRAAEVPEGHNLRLADSLSDAGQEAAVVPSVRHGNQTAAVPLTAPSEPADAQGVTTVTTEVAALIPSNSLHAQHNCAY
jgi:hypothetical protein